MFDGVAIVFVGDVAAADVVDSCDVVNVDDVDVDVNVVVIAETHDIAAVFKNRWPALCGVKEGRTTWERPHKKVPNMTTARHTPYAALQFWIAPGGGGRTEVGEAKNEKEIGGGGRSRGSRRKKHKVFGGRKREVGDMRENAGKCLESKGPRKECVDAGLEVK